MLFRYFFVLICTFIIPLTAQGSLIVGIAGGSGSGKTTFAKKIKETFGENAVLIEQDAYYKDMSHLTIDDRKHINFDHPESLDFDLICSHLLALKQGESILKPTYDFSTHSRTPIQQEICPAKIIIIEGVLLFAVAGVRDLCDIKLYIDVEDDIRFIRRLERDIRDRGRTLEEVKDQYLVTVKPMHSLFVAPSKIHADVIIPGVGDTSEAEKIIASRLIF
ncbi:MAG: uridine kinase [Parachlamydiaceae bacterium]|nr:uridine kinase [Parachlamydiaceae bacterium]